MRTVSKANYISYKDWYKEAVGNTDVVLRGISALEYMRLFSGYLYREDIDVYAHTHSGYENLNHHLVDTFEAIDYYVENGVQCTTFEQTVNDMLDMFDTVDTQSLEQALFKYYTKHNSFEGIYIKPQNIERFAVMKERAILYNVE